MSLFTYVKRLIKPTDLPERHLPKHRDLPRTGKRGFQLHRKFASIARIDACIAVWRWNENIPPFL